MESGKTCMVVPAEGLSTDPSRACSACAVASLVRGKHTDVSLCPDVVCYLNIAWCDPARESFPTAVRETWWHKMPYFRNGLSAIGRCVGDGRFPVRKADWPETPAPNRSTLAARVGCLFRAHRRSRAG